MENFKKGVRGEDGSAESSGAVQVRHRARRPSGESAFSDRTMMGRQAGRYLFLITTHGPKEQARTARRRGERRERGSDVRCACCARVCARGWGWLEAGRMRSAVVRMMAP